MTFKEGMTSDLAVFYDTDEFADTITYNGADIPAVVGDEEVDEGAEGRETARPLSIRVSDVAQPAYRDTIIISTVTYRLKQWSLTSDGLEWQLKAVRDQKPVW